MSAPAGVAAQFQRDGDPTLGAQRPSVCSTAAGHGHHRRSGLDRFFSRRPPYDVIASLAQPAGAQKAADEKLLSLALRDDRQHDFAKQSLRFWSE